MPVFSVISLSGRLQGGQGLQVLLSDPNLGILSIGSASAALEGWKEHTASSLSNASLLEPLTLGLSLDFDARELTRLRNQFYQDLLEKKDAKFMKNNKLEPVNLPKYAADFSLFFINEMLRPGCITRLNKVIKCYTAKDARIDQESVAQADHWAENPGAPLALRNFIRSFSKAGDAQVTVAPLTPYGRLQHMQRELELFRRYDELKTRLKGNDQELRVFLETNGVGPKRGKRLQSRLYDFLMEELHITRNQLQYRTQLARGVADMQEQFGTGVITMLPQGTMDRLSRWGSQRMGEVYPLLKVHADSLQPICNLLREQLLEPMRNGQPLRMSELGLDIDKPLLEIISEACYDAKQNEDSVQDGKEAEQDMEYERADYWVESSEDGNVEMGFDD